MMNNIYTEKRECWLCQRTGKMHMIRFAELQKSRKLTGTKKLLFQQTCPVCEGKGHLQIIRKK